MYNVTSLVKAMFDNNYKQVIRITCNPVTGDSFTLDENDIISGSLSIDRYSVTGDRIEIGTASAGELSFKIKNYDGEWSNTTFEGCEMYVRIGIADWTQNPTETQINYIPCGYFKVDRPVKNAKILEITALDRMAKFDRYVDTSSLLATYNPRTLIDLCCTQCGVLLANGSELADLPNANYAVSIPENIGELTYRNLLQSACMLLGTCAFIDWNGLLRVMWYTPLNTEGSELLDFGELFWSQTINESSGRQTDFDYSPLSKTFTINGSSTIGWNFKIGEVTLNAGTYLLTGINRNNRPVNIKLTGTGINAIDSGEGATFTVTDSNTTLLVYLTSPEGDITYDNLEVKPSLFKTADVYPYYTSSKRYSHTIQEKDIEITGVYYAYEDEERVLHEYINGTKDYCLDISDNPFISRETVESAVQALGTALVGFRYRPLTMSVKPAPYLYPMDMFDFVTADGDTVHGIVSKITFGVNARTHIESNGQTNEDNGYATYGNFTSVQSKIIEKAKTQISRVVNERTTMLLNLNELIANSLGLYVTAVPVTGGGYQYYFHDASTLAGSNIIYTFTANGLAWTDDWNDGSPVWQYGITRDGNAIVNMLNAYKISADVITAGTMNAVNLIFGTAPNTTELRTNDTSNGALFKGQGVMDFETVGRFRAQNKLSLTGNVANEIYMWHDSSSSSIRLANKNESGSADANRIRLTATPAGAHSFQMQNYTADGVLANVFQQTVSPNVGAIQIFNYNLAQSTSSAGVIANRLAMQHSSASVNINSLEIANMATGSANIANTITLSNNENSDFSKLSVTNNDRNGNTLRNQLELYDGSSDQYFELANFQGSTIKRGYVRGYLSGGTANVKVAANNNNNGTASEVASIEVRSDGYLYIRAKGRSGSKAVGWIEVDGNWLLGGV